MSDDSEMFLREWAEDIVRADMLGATIFTLTVDGAKRLVSLATAASDLYGELKKTSDAYLATLGPEDDDGIALYESARASLARAQQHHRLKATVGPESNDG